MSATVGSLNNLINLIAKLPGLGQRSAQRLALYMLKNQEKMLIPLAELLHKVSQEAKFCETCHNIDIKSPCHICTDEKRDQSIVCVVEDISSLWAMERGSVFKGIYHILGGTLSALDGRTPDKLNFDSLKNRIANNNIKEVIIATNSTLDGQTTGFYLVDLLKPYNVRTSRLASGIPVGAELDYMDEGTLAIALRTRQDF